MGGGEEGDGGMAGEDFFVILWHGFEERRGSGGRRAERGLRSGGEAGAAAIHC